MNYFFCGTFCFDRDFRSLGQMINIETRTEQDPVVPSEQHRRIFWNRDQRAPSSIKTVTTRSWRDPHSRKGKPAARKLELRLG